MPVVKLKIKKGGKIEADFMGFQNSFCDKAENDIKARLKNLKLEGISEERKDDELLQEENEYV